MLTMQCGICGKISFAETHLYQQQMNMQSNQVFQIANDFFTVIII
jgi:hypothetical protein